MILDFKYHIFTITAIFAALAIGIMIGTSIIGHDGLIEEQKKIINNINREIHKLKTENINLQSEFQRLNQELSHRKSMEQEYISLLLKDNMEGKNFVLFTEYSDENTLEEVKAIFKLAGAKLKIITDFTSLDLDDNKIGNLIVWKVSREKNNYFTEGVTKYAERVLVSQKSNLIGLISTLMEIDNDEKRE